MDDELVMYVIVNDDAKMRTGKIAAQVAHSAVKIAIISFQSNQNTFGNWMRGSYAKIVLKAKYQTMKNILEKYSTTKVVMAWTCDEGRTQVKPGTLTTIAFEPMPKSEIISLVPELKELKLL